MENLDEATLKLLTGLAQQVDKILKEELKKENIDYDLVEARIYNLKSVGVQGDQRTYSYPAEITLYKKGDFIWKPDFLSRLSTRIPNEVQSINRVIYTIGIKE